jgi:hypothetical protein
MLLDLLDEHQGAFEYDWRTRFHLSASVIPVDMGWAEAWRMAEILLADPSSMLGASFAGWQYPLTRGELTLRDLYDLQHRSKSRKKPKLYPRPWDVPTTRLGTASLTVEEYQAFMAANTHPTSNRPR